jgi:hypothetical protein
MALITGDRFVFSLQRKRRFLMVEKSCPLPAFDIVAAVATVFELSFMDIVFLVTAVTGIRGFFQLGILVAFEAFHLLVLVQQWEVGLAVIES